MNNQTITWTTARGAKIEIGIRTERELIADHTMTKPCWEIDLTVNGNACVFVGRIDHPTAGPAIKLGGAVAPIPADKVTAVDGLIAHYMQEMRRRMDERYASEAAYKAQHDRIDRAR